MYFLERTLGFKKFLESGELDINKCLLEYRKFKILLRLVSIEKHRHEKLCHYLY